MTTYSKKELAEKLGFIMPSYRINYESLKNCFVERGLLNELNLTIEQYNQRRRFNAVESQVIAKKLLA